MLIVYESNVCISIRIYSTVMTTRIIICEDENVPDCCKE
uniref:Uncharacterized protein n=1 Tax=Setaria viridis TaxID=4556 RepID=A0A4U6U0W0_SETVI|nr:hypothetical protein SEVIR_6G069566v2 [Setaria viridis]